MFEELRLEHLIDSIKQSFEKFCDVRKGKNIRYSMVDAGMGAFSVFFTQSPSFLSYQQDMKRLKGRCNPREIRGQRRKPVWDRADTL
jgi:hypothetical protein